MTTAPTVTPSYAERTDATLALGASGLLRHFNDAGVLGLADVHLAQRLGRLGGEPDERVLLAIALLSRAVRGGSVVLRVADAASTTTLEDAEVSPQDLSLLPWPEPSGWHDALVASPLVGDGAPGTTTAGHGGPLTPLRLHEGTLWLDRYWQYEQRVADHLLTRAAEPVPADPQRVRTTLDRLWPDADAADQRAATAAALLQRVAVICGGPGTGKTTTVARLLAALVATAPEGHPIRWALAAPTGKAASRLQEAVRTAAVSADSAGGLFTDAEVSALQGATASTLHRLLQIRRDGPPLRTARDPLPHDVVIVDEASMVSLTLMAQLLDALRPDARLVLVGDPDQLASVEAGAVLADISDRVRLAAMGTATVERTADATSRWGQVLAGPSAVATAEDSPAARLRDGIVLLRRVHRFDEHGAIGRLSDAIRRGDPATVLTLLRNRSSELTWYEVDDEEPVRGPARDHLQQRATDLGVRLATAAGWTEHGLAPDAVDVPGALEALDSYRLLCAHRTGPRGVALWTAAATAWTCQATGIHLRRDGRHPGEPLLVTVNDPWSGLSNGDTGVVVADQDGTGGVDGDLVAVFGTADGGHVVLPLGRLPEVRPLYAGTVHKSQGSQLRAVTVLLPPPSSPLATRQMLYTAVTRAREQVTLIGSEAAVTTAVTRPAVRATGLAARLT